MWDVYDGQGSGGRDVRRFPYSNYSCKAVFCQCRGPFAGEPALQSKVRYELEPEAAGTRLSLSHVLYDVAGGGTYCCIRSLRERREYT
jgi:hypothetical protein